LSLRSILVSVLLCLLPVAELRGGLPYALASGIPPVTAYVLCVAANALVGPLVFLFMSSLHRLLARWGPYSRFFERFVARARHRVHAAVERYGYIGLMVFVAVPLPFTGAYTGAVGAWVLGMNRWKSMLFVALGVALAGLAVSAVYLMGIKTLFIFIGK